MAFPDDHARQVVLLFDEAGNPLLGQKIMAESVPVTMSSDQSPIQVTIGAPGGQGAVSDFVTNGGSEDMVVNGGGTPVTFSFDADPTDDITLNSIRIVMSAASFDFNGASFGKGGGALTTGVEVKITANNGSFVDTLILLKVNEDLFRLLEVNSALGVATSVVAASLAFGGNVQLIGGSSDKIEIVINDNLTTGARGINYLTGTVYGVLVL
jgi:hypothetical protein